VKRDDNDLQHIMSTMIDHINSDRSQAVAFGKPDDQDRLRGKIGALFFLKINSLSYNQIPYEMQLPDRNILLW